MEEEVRAPWGERVATAAPVRGRKQSAEALGRRSHPLFGSLKKERIKKQIYKNRMLPSADVADYIEAFYNRERRHSYLGGVSPEQFEAVHKRHRQRLH